MVILRRTRICLAIFLWPCVGWSQNASNPPISTYYDDLKSKLDGEIAERTLAVAHDPSDAINYYNLGAVEFKRGDLEPVGKSLGSGQKRRG